MSRMDERVAMFIREVAHVAGSGYFQVRKLEFDLIRSLRPDLFAGRYERALELGCGLGFKSLLMSQYAGWVDGVDMTAPYHGFPGKEPAVEIGRRALEKIGCDNVALHGSDLELFMAGHPGSYDLIYSEYLLEHIENIPRLCQAMRACLKDNGVMIHVAPNTHDALIQLSQENMRPLGGWLLRWLKHRIKSLFSADKRRPKIMGAGALTPIPHSEFLTNYLYQFDVYRLENYLFPMMEAGFTVIGVIPVREHSNALFLRKNQAPSGGAMVER